MSYHSSSTKFQKERFKELIPHFKSTPLIDRKLINHGITNDYQWSIDKISDLPLMNKVELRENSILDRSPLGLDQLEYIFSSSGTSGEPTLYFWTKTDTEVLRHAGLVAMERVEVNSNDLAMIIAPTGIPIMAYCMNNQYNLVNVGVLPIGIQPPDIILETIQKFPVTILTTLPVFGIWLFEFHLLNNKHGMIPGNLRQFHVGGDFLSEGRRKLIEQLWKVECYNFYGLSEILGPIAGECKEKNGMHFLSEYIYLEVLDPETRMPVPEGEPGIAVYTTLWKKGTPLLRYWSEDFVTIQPGQCKCGDKSPKIKFLGRLEDSVVLNGKRIFPFQIEDLLFQFPIGGEFVLELNPSSTSLLKIENIPGEYLPLKQVEIEISNFLGLPCNVQALIPGTFSRRIPKPKRLIIQ